MSAEPGTVRIAGVIRQSIVDGPGLRLVVFTQGCARACPGCHNPQSHDFDGGYDCDIQNILSAMDENPLLMGITLSGGEPFARAGELVPLVQAVREREKDVWCFTGYTFEELAEMAGFDRSVDELLRLVDVLVDGPFLQEQKDLTLRFRGSRNQRVLDVPRSLDAGKPVVIEAMMQ